MPINTAPPHARGFTLVEVLLYTVIFSSMIGFLVVSVFQLLDTQKSGRGRASVETEADFVMGKIDWALTSAQTINAPAANATGTTLSVNKANYANNPIVFDVVSGAVRITKGAGEAAVVTSDDVAVQELKFQHLAQAGNQPEGVTVTLVIAASSTAAASTTVHTTIYLNK